jgi:hypothetical protein
MSRQVAKQLLGLAGFLGCQLVIWQEFQNGKPKKKYVSGHFIAGTQAAYREAARQKPSD